MNCPDWLKVLVPARRGAGFRRLTAYEVLQARREALDLAKEERELALCGNACLVARGVTRRGRRAYRSGREVLDRCAPEKIQALAQAWTDFDRAQGLGLGMGEARFTALKESLAGLPRQRLRWRVLKAFGALPTEKRAREMTEEDFLWCAANLVLDGEEALAGLCPACRQAAEKGACPVCGGEIGEAQENEAFDWARYEKLKAGEV